MFMLTIRFSISILQYALRCLCLRSHDRIQHEDFERLGLSLTSQTSLMGVLVLLMLAAGHCFVLNNEPITASAFYAFAGIELLVGMALIQLSLKPVN